MADPADIVTTGWVAASGEPGPAGRFEGVE
jgi:hypothetical protein